MGVIPREAAILFVFAKFLSSRLERVVQGRSAAIDEGGKSDREQGAVGGAGPVSRRLLLSYFPERWLEGNFSSVELKLAPARNAHGIFNSANAASLSSYSLSFLRSFSNILRNKLFNIQSENRGMILSIIYIIISTIAAVCVFSRVQSLKLKDR